MASSPGHWRPTGPPHLSAPPLPVPVVPQAPGPPAPEMPPNGETVTTSMTVYPEGRIR